MNSPSLLTGIPCLNMKANKAKSQRVILVAAPSKPKARRTRRARRPSDTTPSAPTALAVSKTAQPRNVVRAFTRDSETVSFCELLSAGLSTGTASSSVILNIPLGMSSFAGTRVGIMAGLWEKFRFRRLTIKVISSVPTTSGGNGLVAWDADPVDPVPPSNTLGMQALTAQENSKIFALWQGADLPLNLRSLPDAGFFTNAGSIAAASSDPRLYQQGQIFLAILNAPASSQTVSVMIEGEVEFFARNLQVPAGSTEFANTSSTLLTVPSATSGTVWNMLQPLAAGVAGQLTALNGLKLPNVTVQADGSYGLPLPQGIYQILYGANNVQVPSPSGTTSVQGRSVDPPGSRQASTLTIDPYFLNSVPGTAADGEDVFLRWVLQVPDILGAVFSVGMLDAGGGTGNNLAHPALQLSKVLSL